MEPGPSRLLLERLGRAYLHLAGVVVVRVVLVGFLPLRVVFRFLLLGRVVRRLLAGPGVLLLVLVQ